MLRIILGILINLGFISSMANPAPAPADSTEAFGYFAGRFAVIALAAWLIHSGMALRARAKKEDTSAVSFAQFAKGFATHPMEFFRKHITEKHPPFLLVPIWLMGISVGLNRLDQLALGDPVRLYDAGWATLWPVLIAVGLFIGFAGYWVLGLLFHILVRVSGGSGNFRLSRHIFIFSQLPIYLATLASKIYYTFAAGNAYFLQIEYGWTGRIWTGILLCANLYALFLAYQGARLAAHAKPIRAAIFLIALPIALYVVLWWRMNI